MASRRTCCIIHVEGGIAEWRAHMTKGRRGCGHIAGGRAGGSRQGRRMPVLLLLPCEEGSISGWRACGRRADLAGRVVWRTDTAQRVSHKPAILFRARVAPLLLISRKDLIMDTGGDVVFFSTAEVESVVVGVFNGDVDTWHACREELGLRMTAGMHKARTKSSLVSRSEGR